MSHKLATAAIRREVTIAYNHQVYEGEELTMAEVDDLIARHVAAGWIAYVEVFLDQPDDDVDEAA